MALAIIVLTAASTIIAVAVLHFREKEANKNGNGLEHLKSLIKK